MSNKLLGEGNTVASIDELYLFLSNLTAIEYIRNAMKRVRKKDSAVILASQNIDDFLIPSVKEYTKPLFSIPTHHFLFFPGNINPKDFEDALMVEPNEYALIKFGERGTCLYRCGNERYNNVYCKCLNLYVKQNFTKGIMALDQTGQQKMHLHNAIK